MAVPNLYLALGVLPDQILQWRTILQTSIENETRKHGRKVKHSFSSVATEAFWLRSEITRLLERGKYVASLTFRGKVSIHVTMMPL